MSNFVLDCINGNALTMEIDEYIDKWHQSDTSLPVYEYLGMSIKDYALFVLDNNYLGAIIASHKEGKALEDLISCEIGIAARSDNPSKSRRLQNWLESEGLWK